MQRDYVYFLSEPVGKNFDPEFRPELIPKEMLELGVFGGKYMTDCGQEFLKSWYKKAKLCAEKHDPQLNYFGINASQPLPVWREKAGFMRMTPGDGFNGIAAIIGEGEFLKKTGGR